MICTGRSLLRAKASSTDTVARPPLGLGLLGFSRVHESLGTPPAEEVEGATTLFRHVGVALSILSRAGDQLLAQRLWREATRAATDCAGELLNPRMKASGAHSPSPTLSRSPVPPALRVMHFVGPVFTKGSTDTPPLARQSFHASLLYGKPFTIATYISTSKICDVPTDQ